MPESASALVVRGWLRRLQRNFRIRAVSDAVLLGAAAAALMLAVGGVMRLDDTTIVGLAAATWILLTAAAASLWWRQWTLRRAAQMAERNASFENLLITAEETLAVPNAVHPILREELFRQAEERVQAVDWRALASPSGHLIRSALVSLAAIALTVMVLQNERPFVRSVDSDPSIASQKDTSVTTLIATVVPPAYTGRSTATIENPIQIHVLEGSRLKLELPRFQGKAEVIESGQETTPFERSALGGSFETHITASRVFLIRQSALQKAPHDRLLQVIATPDRAPVVRIRKPARDLLYGEPRGSIAVEFDASDDIGLASIALRYTTVSGSGEGLTFAEGELPLQMRTTDDRQWSAQTEIALANLKLAVGDTLVYRAIARDRRPGGDPATSESFLVEIGKRGTATSAGFAIPEERDRQGLSQQMLIVKTERLHATRGGLANDEVMEQSRMLAVEQRMVRAEFVFMTGGEVEDEVAEAEHGHELVEGRFENEGQMELLNAIREMSRAEARLNAGDTTQALVFERAALRALQRAFDRRRYLLRTLPERARIDLSRRLSGDLRTARSSSRRIEPTAADPSIPVIRRLLADLAISIESTSGLDATMAARIVTVNPTSTALQQSALGLATGSNATRAEAAVAAQQHLIDLLKTRLATAAEGKVVRDPFAGHVADQLRQPRGQR